MKLPQGFVLDEPPQVQGATLPQGFVLDNQAAFDPSAYGEDFKAARAAIDKLPPDQRQAAIEAYARDFVTKERAGGGVMQSVSDHIRMAARNVPIVGEFADELNALTAYITGGDYEMAHAAEQERRRQIDATERPGVQTPLGEIDTGDIAKGAGLVGGIIAAPGLAPFRGGTTAAAGGNAAATAALYGGADAAGRKVGGLAEKGLSGLKGAAVAAPFGYAGGVVGQKIGDWAAKGSPVWGKGKGLDDLKRRASANYKAADEAGVIFSDSLTKRLSGEMKQALADFAYHPKLQPKVKVLVDEVDRLANGNVTLKGLDTFRKMVTRVSADLDPSTRAAAGKLIEKIDDALLKPRPGEVLGGNVQAGTKALREARAGWRQMRKVELLDDALQRADDRIASTYGGGNIDNAVRQQFRRLLDNRKTARMFTQAEKDELRKVIMGGNVGNFLRQIGKFSPTSGLNPGMYLYAGISNPAYGTALAAAGAATQVAKHLGNRMTRQSADQLIEKLSGGQLGTKFSRWQNAIRSGTSEATKAAATRGMAQAIAQAANISVKDAVDALMSTLSQSVDVQPGENTNAP